MKRLHGWWPAIVIVVAGIVAYWHTFGVPFLFDDTYAVVENPSIRHLGSALSPARDDGTTVSGRPVFNLSLAVNYAIGGTDPWSYHAVNLLIHIGAGLALFGILRRTTSNPQSAFRIPQSTLFAFLVALLWSLHPLQTESVTYIAQRAESLAGLFCLLTLYCFIRSADEAQGAGRSGHGSGWASASVACCLCGMGTKEVMAGAPLIVLLYDRTFCAGSLREAWARRKRYYVALAACWIALGALVASTGGRGSSAGFDTEVPVLGYLVTQGWAIVHYLRLAAWPSPQVFDYGPGNIAIGAAWPSLAITCVLFLTVLGLCLRKSAVGFLGATFFILLAPSSSLVPIASQAIAEHRMYLALAPVFVLAVLAARRFLGRAAGPAAGIAACVLAATTMARNETYRTELGLWQDTAAKWPANPRAHFNVGSIVLREGKPLEAIGSFERAVAANPSYPEAEYALGVAYSQLGRQTEAIAHYQRALEIRPVYPRAANNLALLLADQGQWQEAARLYRSALQVNSAEPAIVFNLGVALIQLGDDTEATTLFNQALQADQSLVQALHDFGVNLEKAGRFDRAVPVFTVVVKAAPDVPSGYQNLGTALLASGQPAAAIPQLEKALSLKPDFPEAHLALARALTLVGRGDEAAAHAAAARNPQ